MSEHQPYSRLDEHLRLRLKDLPWQQFERFMLSFLNSTISLKINRHGERIERRVIEANSYAAGSGRSQDGIDLIATMEGGETWVFQCKRVKSWSPSKTVKAIAKASGFPANHYFLIVTCDPHEGVQKEILKHPNWTFWNLDRICDEFRRVPQEQQPLILNFLDPAELKRFAPYSSDAFISLERYQDALIKRDRSFLHRHPFVGQESELKRLEDFATEKNRKVMLLSGKGGEGKSRLVLEFAKELQQKHPEIHTYFLNPHAKDDKLTALWSAPKPRLLVVDDAHRIERVSHDLLNCVQEDLETKLLLVTRLHGNGILKDLLREHGLTEKTQEKELSPLKKSERNQLAEYVLGPELKYRAPALLALTGDSPFLITLAGDLLREKRIQWRNWSSDRDFYASILRSFEVDNMNLFDESDRKDAAPLLRLIAMLSPVTPDAIFIQKVSACLEIPEVRVELLIQRLKATGAISAAERNIRVIPDLFSDFLVFETALDPENRKPTLSRKILESFPQQSAVLIRNLAEAAWLAEAESIHRDELLRPLLDVEFSRFDQLSFFERGTMLKDWSAFSIFLPKESLQLARKAINLEVAPKIDFPISVDWYGIESHRYTKSWVPKLLKPVALHHSEFRSEALDLIWRLGLETTRKYGDKGHPWEAIADVLKIQPNKPLEVSESCLEWISNLVRRSETETILESHLNTLSILLMPCFVHTIEFSEWKGRTCSFWRRPVNISNTTAIRTQALAILKWVVENRSWKASVGVVGALGYALRRVTPFEYANVTNPEKYRASWLPERLKALALLSVILKRHPQTPVSFAVREWLVRDLPYEEDPVFKETARELLRFIPENLDLQIARALLTQGHHDYSEAFEADDAKILRTQSRELWDKKLEDIAKLLLHAYPDPESCIQFLSKAASDLLAGGYSPMFIFLFPVISRVDAIFGESMTYACIDSTEQNLVSESWYQLLLGMSSDVIIDAVLLKAKTTPKTWLRKGIILYLLFKCHPTGGLSLDQKALIENLAIEAGEEEIEKLLQLVGQLEESDVAWGYHLLEKLPLESIAIKHHRELLETLYPYRERAAAPPLSTVKHVFHALIPVPEIEIDYLGRIFEKLINAYPNCVYDLLLSRLEFATETSMGFKYKALFNPLVGELRLSPLSKTPEYPSICEFLWQKIAGELPEATRFDWLTLFQLVVLENDKFWIPRLQEKIIHTIEWDELRNLVRFISFDGSLIIFRYPEITLAFLKRADQIDRIEGLKGIQSALYVASGPKGRTYTNGTLDADNDYVESEALKAAELYASDHSLGPFYRWIAGLERENRERQKQWHQSNMDDDD